MSSCFHHKLKLNRLYRGFIKQLWHAVVCAAAGMVRDTLKLRSSFQMTTPLSRFSCEWFPRGEQSCLDCQLCMQRNAHSGLSHACWPCLHAWVPCTLVRPAGLHDNACRSELPHRSLAWRLHTAAQQVMAGTVPCWMVPMPLMPAGSSAHSHVVQCQGTWGYP